MKKEWADKWVADLRNPELKQGFRVLFNGTGYCCLGRAVVITGRTFEKFKSHKRTDDIGYKVKNAKEDNEICLTETVKKQLGMTYGEGMPRTGKVIINDKQYGSLAEANDAGCTFAQIADWIEKNYERL